MKSSLASVLTSRTTRVVALFLSVSAIAFGGFFISQAQASVPPVVINEFSSGGSSDWVELYNTTGASVDLTGWTVKDFAGHNFSLSASSIPAHGFVIADAGSYLNNLGDEMYVFDATNATTSAVAYGGSNGAFSTTTVDYDYAPAPASGQSAYRTTDGGGTWALTSAPTKDTTNTPAPVPVVSACNGSTFDSGFTDGSVNGQNGWRMTGAYDAAIVDNTYGYSTFGCKTLRISNAVTTGAFGNQTFAASTTVGAGESAVAPDNHFEAQFDIAAAQLDQQPGLALSVSPDNGSGARMSYVRFEDHTDGIHVYFDDAIDAGPLNAVATWNENDIATLSRSESHTIKFVMDFVDGPSNDVVKIYIDGALVHTGTSWEDYYRYDPEQKSGGNVLSPVNTLIFRAAGTAASSASSKGYLFDNVSLSTSNVPQVGSIHIKKYECPVGTTVNRDDNGVGKTAPVGCVPEGGAHFGYTHGSQTNANAPYDDFNNTLAAGGSTDSSGNLTISNLAAIGRYVVFETDSSNVKFGNADLLGLYCAGDADPNPHHNDNGDITFVSIGGTAECAAYDEAPPDMTRPTLVYNYPAANAWATSTLPVSVTASDAGSGIASLIVHYYNGDSFLGSCGSGQSSLGGVASSTYTCALSTSALADGNYSLRSGTFDVAHNNQTVSLPFGIDNTKPIAALTAPVQGSTQTGTFTITGTATDTLSGVDHVDIYLAHNPWSAGGYAVNKQSATYDPETGAFSYHATGIPDGAYDVKAVVYDKAGNVRYALSGNAGLKINVVNTVPMLTITAPATDGSYVSGAYAFTASYTHGVTNALDWAVRKGTSCSSGTVAGNVDGHHDASALADGAFTASLDTTAWADGQYCFVVNDLHGHRPTRLFTVDNIGPSVPTITSPVDGEATTTAGLQHVFWTGAADTGVTYIYQSSLSDATTTIGAFVHPAYTSSPLTTMYIATPNTPAGTYYLHVMAKDSSGKTSAWSPVVKVTVMTALPLTYTYATTTIQAADLATSFLDVVADPTKWFFYSDTSVDGHDYGIDTSLGLFVTGPSTAPAGSGSAQMTLGANPADRIALATYQFSGTLLADIQQMQYSLYEQTNAGAAPALQFNIDLNGTDAWQHRLLYEPSGNGQQILTLNSWNTIDAYQNGNALWTWSGLEGHGGSATQWPDGKTAVYRTWYDIVSSFPKARVRVTDSWLGFRIGSPGPVGYTSDVDKFIVGIKNGSKINTTTYDFEPTTSEHHHSNPNSTGGILGDLNNDRKIDFRDLAIMMSAFGKRGTNFPADLNHDGIVDVADFAILLGNWSK